MGRQPSRRVFGLDLLRAYAIVSVVASHGVGTIFVDRPQVARLTWAVPFGVDVFFVLSGYLIGGILIRDLTAGVSAARLGRFWVRRWFRTVPNYALFLAVNAGIAGWPGAAFGYYATFTQNLAWPMAAKFFAESWSLAVEEWFYLTVPAAAAAVACRRGGPGRVKAGLLTAAGVGFAVAQVARWGRVVALDPAFDAGVRKVAVCRFDSLMWGVGLAAAAAWAPATFARLRRPGLAAGLVAFTAAGVWAATDLDHSVTGRTLLFDLTNLGVAGLVVFAAGWPTGPGWAGPAVERVAVWSYSMYLVNLPVLTLLRRHGGAADLSVAGAAAQLAAFALLVVGLSALIYRYYETPMTRLRERV